MSDEIELRRADGVAYRGWTEVSVEQGLEDIAVAWSFRQVLTGHGIGLQLAVGAPVSVWIGDDQVCDGYIDRIQPRRSVGGREITVSGRSLAGDLVDNSAPVETYRRVTIGRLADILAAPYGVGVVDSAGDSHVFARVRPMVGDKISDVLLRLAKQRGLLLTSDRTGALVIARADAPADSGAEIHGGVTDVEMSGEVSQVGRFQSYEVRGQSVGEQDALADSTAIVTDAGVTRARKLVVKPDHPVDAAGAKVLAEWEAVTRAGRSQRVTYTIPGWRQPNGDLWTPGTTVPVWDPLMRLAGQQLLIVSVKRTLTNATGRRTEVELQPPEAFAPYVATRPTIVPAHDSAFGIQSQAVIDGIAASVTATFGGGE